MKRLLFVALVLCLLWAGLQINAFERVDRHIGDDTLTVRNADAGTWTSKNFKLLDSVFNAGYTAAKLGIIVNAFALSDESGADSITGAENAIDTAIVTLYGKTEFYSEQLDRDSAASLPCTLLLDYNYFYDASPDSSVGAQRQLGLCHDDFYFTVYAADSAGTGDTIETRILWWLHLLEE